MHRRHLLIGGASLFALGGCAATGADLGGVMNTVTTANEAAIARAVLPATAPKAELLQVWTGPYEGVPPWDKVTAPKLREAVLEAIDLRDEVSALIGAGTLEFSGNIVASTGNLGQSADEQGDTDDDYSFDEKAWIRSPQNNNNFRVESAMLAAARNVSSPNFQPIMTSRQMQAVAPPQSEFFDESAVYQGAINPIAEKSWLEGWTAFPES